MKKTNKDVVDIVLANLWTTAMDLYHNKKLNTIDASVRTKGCVKIIET